MERASLNGSKFRIVKYISNIVTYLYGRKTKSFLGIWDFTATSSEPARWRHRDNARAQALESDWPRAESELCHLIEWPWTSYAASHWYYGDAGTSLSRLPWHLYALRHRSAEHSTQLPVPRDGLSQCSAHSRHVLGPLADTILQHFH